MDWRYTTPPTGQPVPYQPVASAIPTRPLPFAAALPAEDQTAVPAGRPFNIPPTVSEPVTAALVGAVIGGANNFGRNLVQVRQGKMTVSQALGRGVMHGAATSLATTIATLLTADVRQSHALHLTALAITAGGLSYLIEAGLNKTVKRRAATV